MSYLSEMEDNSLHRTTSRDSIESAPSLSRISSRDSMTSFDEYADLQQFSSAHFGGGYSSTFNPHTYTPTHCAEFDMYGNEIAPHGMAPAYNLYQPASSMFSDPDEMYKPKVTSSYTSTSYAQPTYGWDENWRNSYPSHDNLHVRYEEAHYTTSYGSNTVYGQVPAAQAAEKVEKPFLDGESVNDIVTEDEGLIGSDSEGSDSEEAPVQESEEEDNFVTIIPRRLPRCKSLAERFNERRQSTPELSHYGPYEFPAIVSGNLNTRVVAGCLRVTDIERYFVNSVRRNQARHAHELRKRESLTFSYPDGPRNARRRGRALRRQGSARNVLASLDLSDDEA